MITPSDQSTPADEAPEGIPDDPGSWDASLRPPSRVVLPPNDPEAICCKCGGDNITLRFHEKALFFLDDSRFFPCTRFAGPSGSFVLDEHLCKNCETCGFAWMEAVAGPGPLYGLVVIGAEDEYADLEGEGGAMTIRKTGSATGMITGIDQDTTALSKEGAARRPWDDADEADLRQENDAVDSADDNKDA